MTSQVERSTSSRANLVVFALYGLLLIGLVGGLATARQKALNSRDVGGLQDDWETWREEAGRQEQGAGPVLRRKPRSDEPPTLVLLRDHFSTSLLVLVVLSSALYFALAFMVRGALSGPKFEPDLRKD